MGRIEWVVLRIAPFIDFFASRCRPLCMLVVVCPLSFLLRIYLGCLERRARSRWPVGSSIHDAKVRRVQAAVKRHQQVQGEGGGRKRMLCTSRAQWQNLSTKFSEYKERSDCIWVGDLSDMIEIDVAQLEVKLGPLVEKGAITRYLETVVQYDVVLGDGTLVHARRDNAHSDLWHALPWSHGSLGLLVGLTMKIVPVKPYVRVEYVAHRSMAAYCKHIRDLSLTQTDFVEATVFSHEEAVVMKCDFVDKVGKDGSRFFYTHVRGLLERCVARKKDTATMVDYVPTLQYDERAGNSRERLPERIGNNFLVRLLFGWMYPPKDIVLPISTLEEAIPKADKLFKIWPILVYPSRVYDHGPGKRGIFPQPREKDMVGAPFLYADTFMDRAERLQVWQDELADERLRKFVVTTASPQPLEFLDVPRMGNECV
eukprot:gene40919-23510_t